MLNILLLTLFFQGSYMPNWNINYGINEYEYEHLDLTKAYQIELGIDLYFLKSFFIKGSIKNIFHSKKGELWYYPDCDQYRIACGIRYKELEIGYEHLCFHPIFPYTSNNRQEEKGINNALLEGSYDKLYVKFQLQAEF